MNRRSFLTLAGSLPLASSSGCIESPFEPQKRRLWYIFVMNNGKESYIGIRVRRNGEIAFENQYHMPAFWAPGPGRNRSTFGAGKPNIKVIEHRWNTEPAVFEVEYKIQGQDRWHSMDFAGADSKHVGAYLTFWPQPYSSAGSTDVHEIGTREDVEAFFARLDRERQLIENRTSG